MCGIFGKFFDLNQKINSINLEETFSLLNHRGPDDSGFLKFKTDILEGVLGHTRLSIIDLTDGGKQPMSDDSGRYSLIFNGEIYNYLELKEELIDQGIDFKTKSDTEVLLNAWIFWGTDSLSKLEGMFSFAVYDLEKNTLHLVRDPFGIKPLYYYSDNSSLYFSSEIPTILSMLPEKPPINVKTSYEYLVHGEYDSAEDTFFEKIYQLMPGHYAFIDFNKNYDVKSFQWFNPSIEENKNLDFESAKSILKEKLLKSINRHLRSDVPIGVALSGGIDSSVIACAIREIYPDKKINTFSFVSEDLNQDESKWIDIVNNHIDGNSHKVVINDKDFFQDLDEVISLQGEPFTSTSVFAQYKVFELAKKNNVKVVLDGQGADEMFAGYHGYPHARIISLIGAFKFVDLYKFIKYWRRWPGRSLKNETLKVIRFFLPEFLYNFSLRIIGRNPKPIWFKGSKKLKAIKRKKFNISLKERSLIEQLKSTLLSDLNLLLRHEDRNSMRWSIESRVPFLTKDLADFCLSLPENFLLSDHGQTKHILRESMKSIVPKEILDRKDKIGFFTPELIWIKSLRGNVESYLSDLEKIEFIDHEYFYNLIQDVIDEKEEYDPIIWRAINYSRWYSCIAK